MTNLRRIEGTNTARFVTFCCYQRYQILNDNQRRKIFLEEVDNVRQLRNCKVLGYVIMPEHVHLVLHPQGQSTIGALIGEIKSKSAKRIFEYMRQTNELIPSRLQITRNGTQRNVFWQTRFYDHNCRSDKSVLQKIEYCHKNPVNRKLVNHPGLWRWSSYNWYQGEVDVPLVVDELVVNV